MNHSPKFLDENADNSRLTPGWGRRDKIRTMTRRTILGAGLTFGAGAVVRQFFKGRENTEQVSPSRLRDEAVLERTNDTRTRGRPPEGITERIAFEITRAERLLARAEVSAILKSPWLVSALYYSDGFLERVQKKTDNPAQEILRGLAPLVTHSLRNEFAKALNVSLRPHVRELREREVPPLAHFDFGIGDNHPDAVDLFTQEKTPVKTITRGVVLSAETGWDEKNPFSTSSPRGGNNVIVYAPDEREFYRYCHLGEVHVTPGTLLSSGDTLGLVGHTGENARKPGHGQHLHLEINHLDQGGSMSAVAAKELKKRLAKLVAS